MKRSSRSLLLFFLLFPFTLSVEAQDKSSVSIDASEELSPDVVNFTSTNAEGALYFKSRILRLKQDVHLVLEKRNDEQSEPIVVDSRKGVGTDKEFPILYCFKDENPDPSTRYYRLRAIWFDQEGEYHDEVLAEKRFRSVLLSLNED